MNELIGLTLNHVRLRSILKWDYLHILNSYDVLNDDVLPLLLYRVCVCVCVCVCVVVVFRLLFVVILQE